MTTQELIDFAAVARADDPETSQAAAASVCNITQTKQVILALLERGPLTDVELVEEYNNARFHPAFGGVPRASESGIRSRRAELTRAGLVVESGDFRLTPSGRRAIVWEVSK